MPRGRERSEGLRRAAVVALGRAGALVEEGRKRVADELETLLDDSGFLVALEAVAAAETLGDSRLLPVLDRLAVEAVRRTYAP